MVYAILIIIVPGAEGSGFLNWAFTSQQSIQSTAINSLVFTAQTSSTFSDMAALVVRITATDANSQLGHVSMAAHPFANNEDVLYVVYEFNVLFNRMIAFANTPQGIPWTSITILHWVVGDASSGMFGNLCDFDGLLIGSTSDCGVLLAVTEDVAPGSLSSVADSDSEGGVTPLVSVQKAVLRRAYMGSPNIITVAYIPLVPTVDGNNKALEGVVPWRCGRIVDAKGGPNPSTDCTIQSPEQHSAMHRGCNPPLGTFGNANVSTTVALTWNGTVYMFRPLEFAARTLSCLDPNNDTPPHSCYNFSDLIFTLPMGAAWGFLEMAYPLSARPPPWVFLDASPLTSSKCILYLSERGTGLIALHDLGAPFVNGTVSPVETIRTTIPNCIPSITAVLLDVLYSTNITTPLGSGLSDGLFSTASTLLAVLCGGTADFFVVSPTINYMQQQAPASSDANSVVIRRAGSVVVPFPNGFTGARQRNDFVVTVTRHGTLARLPSAVTISKAAYNALATSGMYTIALAVPSVGLRSESPWAKANNKTYGDDLDSYVSVVTAKSSYVRGFEATVGRDDDSGDIFANDFTMTQSIVQSAFFSILDAHLTDTAVALLEPKDYYASSNVTEEFCQYGPCEWAVPVRDRITAVIGFSQLQQLPPVAQNELLSAEVVLEAACRGSLPFESQSASALVSIHREMVNATASWLLREATSVSVMTLMVSMPINVSDGRGMNFKELNVYSNWIGGNMTASAAIPAGTLSIYGGTSFIQQMGMIDPYDGITGGWHGVGGTNMWLAGDATPDTLNRIYNDQLAAADLFPLRTPALSSRAIAEEILPPVESYTDYSQPQTVLTKFVHEVRLISTLPRTTFYPTAANNGSISSDLPALTACMYQLSDNGAPSITSQNLNLNSFLRYTNSSESNFFARWLYDSITIAAPNYILNQASYIQLALGNNRYGTRRLNTQMLLVISPSDAQVPFCVSSDAEWMFSISVLYGVLSPVGTVIESGPTVRSGWVENEELVLFVNQTIISMFVEVGGAVAFTQSYCSQAPTLPCRGAAIPPSDPLVNITSLTLTSQVGATATGVLFGQQVTCAMHTQQQPTASVHTSGTLSAAYSAAAVTGSATFGLKQPFGNASSPLQWTASDRHASRVSGGNVTSMSAPFGSGGRIVVCQGTTVMLMNQHGESASYDISSETGGPDSNVPCPPDKATCTCTSTSVRVSADVTVAFISFIYTERFNASSIYPSGIEETLVVFFNFTDLSPLGWVAPPIIREQMGSQCPNSIYSTAPFRVSSLAELPLSTLQTTVAQVISGQAAYYSTAPMINSADVVAGLVAAVPGTRCMVVWIVTSMDSLTKATETNASTVQTFVFTSMSRSKYAFSGVVSAFPGTPFISVTQLPSSGAEFNCTYCTPSTLLSVPIMGIVEDIVTAYQPISDEGATVSHRYDFPFAMVPWVVNTSVLYLLTAGEYRIGIQGFPADSEGLNVNGCTLNTSIPCVANFSRLVVLVSNLYSDANTPPLYEIDLVACHTVPLYPNASDTVLVHPPVGGTCRLLFSEPRRNVIFTNANQGVSAYQFLGDSVCVAFGTVVCFQLAPIPKVTSVVLAGSINFGEDYTFDLFFSTPVTSFFGSVAVFNPPGRAPLSLNYKQSSLPILYVVDSGDQYGTDFSQCDNLALSAGTLTLMCSEREAEGSSPKRMAVVDAFTGIVLAANGPYGFEGTTPVISGDGTYVVFINNVLTLSVTFLNLRYLTQPLALTSTVCGVVGEASYTLSFQTEDSPTKFDGAADVVVTSLQPNLPTLRRSLGRALRTPRLFFFFSSSIGNEFNVDDDDASALFTDLLPNRGSTDMYFYRIRITSTVTLIQQSRGSSPVTVSSHRNILALPTPVRALSPSYGVELPSINATLTSSIAPAFTTQVPSFTFSASSCYACIVVDAFSATAQTGQCPSVCTVDALDGFQYRYTAHKGGMLQQTKLPTNASFSCVGQAGTTDITFPEVTDSNSTLVASHFVYRLRAAQDVVPCDEGAAAATVPLPAIQAFCDNLLGDASKYFDVLSVDIVAPFDYVVVSRRLSLSDATGVVGTLMTTLQYVSKRSAYSVDSHVSLLHPLAMAIGMQVLPIASSDPFATVQSAYLLDGGLLGVEVGGQSRQLPNCSSEVGGTFGMGVSTTRCDTLNPSVGEIGGDGDLPLPSSKYLSVTWRGSSVSLWGSGFVRTRHPLPLTYLLHRVPSMNDNERNMQIPTLDVQYANIEGTGGGNQWSSEDAVSCQALPSGAASYDNVTAGGVFFSTNTDMVPPVVCPAKCTPDYASCGSLARHFFDSYLFHSTHITGQPYVLPVGPLTQACWDAMPDVNRFMSMVGYFQQPDTLTSDWTFGRVAQIEFYCTADGQVAITAAVPQVTEGGLHFAYANAKRRVLLRLMSSAEFDGSLGIGLTCTHCMYFMLEGVSAQPFLVMLVGSVKGLLLCYLFYFAGRLAEKKKRQRMSYVVIRGDLLDRLDAIKWVLGVRRNELSDDDTRREMPTPPSSLRQPKSTPVNTASRLLDECAASFRSREKKAANDGLFSMTVAELVAEKRRIRDRIRQVGAAYYGKQAQKTRLSRFLHRVVPNPIDVAIFLLLRLLSFKKRDDVLRVRKAIARTFSTATLSRTELAAHLGVILSGTQHPLDHFRTPTHHTAEMPHRRSGAPSDASTQAALPHEDEGVHNSHSPLLGGSSPATPSPVEGEADQRWYAFAHFYAEHLASDQHAWLVKLTLDTPPPLQSENATNQQDSELRHTHLILHAIYLLYCSLMERVSAPSSTVPGPQGMSVPRRNASHLPKDAASSDSNEGDKGTVSLDAAVVFLRQEVAAYAREWVQLGCLNLPHPSCSHAPRTSPLHSPATPNVRISFHSNLNRVEQNSDFSDADETGHSLVDDGNAHHTDLSPIERRLQFQMDALMLLRAHVSDVSFAVEDDSGQRITKVRFASHIHANTPTSEEDENANSNSTEVPVTSISSKAFTSSSPRCGMKGMLRMGHFPAVRLRQSSLRITKPYLVRMHLSKKIALWALLTQLQALNRMSST